MQVNVLIPPDRNFWMCRADQTKFINHFRQFSVVGIGHFDEIRTLDFAEPRSSIEKKLITHFDKNPKLNKRTVTNHLNQGLHFIYDAKIGDVIISVGTGFILMGVIESNPYFIKEPLTLKAKGPKSNEVKMALFLRRDVKWIGRYDRQSLPLDLSRGIGAQQTFFSLNSYESQIYSLVSQFVYKGEALTTNVHIDKESNISTYQFSKLTNTFLKIEFLAVKLETLSKLKSVDELEAMYREYCELGQNTSSIKAQFASPGQTNNTAYLKEFKAGIYAILFTLSISGGKVSLGEFKAEVPGLLSNPEIKELIHGIDERIFILIDRWLSIESKNLQQQLNIGSTGTKEQIVALQKKHIK